MEEKVANLERAKNIESRNLGSLQGKNQRIIPQEENPSSCRPITRK
jgi:hypothetical protein